jgi:ABC-type sugar transport system permease subunit
MGDLVLATMFYAAIYLLLIVILALPLLFLFRREIRAWITGARWRLGLAFALIVPPVVAWALWQQLYAPVITYAPGVAQFWIRQAAEAPTREERVLLVRRVASSSIEYGAQVAWLAIRHIPDRKTRCELFYIVATTPNIKSSYDLQEAIRAECRD